MARFGTLLRRWLARRGYVLCRIEPEVPPSIGEYLRSRLKLHPQPVSLVCFDSDVYIQSEILGSVPPSQAVFGTPILNSIIDSSVLGTGWTLEPARPFMVLVDTAAFSLDRLWDRLPWLSRAESLLLRSRLGSFWSGEQDFITLQRTMVLRGFEVVDVVDFTGCSVNQARFERPVFVCLPRASSGCQTVYQRYRVNEVAASLSAPIVRRRDFSLLAGRGSCGFAAGVFNPGAVVAGGRTYLLARGEQFPWAAQKCDESLFFGSVQPLLLALNDDYSIGTATRLDVAGLPDSACSRAEDFRLFKYRDQVFTNHAMIRKRREGAAGHRRLRLDELQTRIGISRLDVGAQRLSWCGFPSVDRPLARTEKNWAIFGDGDRLLLLYSFSPYVLLSASNWPGLDFKTILEVAVPVPFDGDGLALRNSVNPIEYDEGHWLHIVHKVYPGKQYSYWAVLIDKKSLRPVRTTERPLVRGWHSSSAAIIYTCSVVADANSIRLFSGLDDSATAVATISRQRLDAEWTTIPQTGT